MHFKGLLRLRVHSTVNSDLSCTFFCRINNLTQLLKDENSEKQKVEDLFQVSDLGVVSRHHLCISLANC